MAIQWFYQTSEGRATGPLDSTQLRRLAEAGIVRPETLVRQGAIGSWVRAEQVQGLFLPSKPAPSSPPGTTPPGRPPLPPRVARRPIDQAFTGASADARSHYLRGLAAAQNQKDFESAVQHFTEAIRIDSDYAEAYVARGCVRLHNFNEHDLAIEDHTKAVTLQPDFALAYFHRADTYWDEGRNHEALNDCDKAISLAPRFAQAHELRARVFEGLGESEPARIDFERAEQLGFCKEAPWYPWQDTSWQPWQQVAEQTQIEQFQKVKKQEKQSAIRDFWNAIDDSRVTKGLIFVVLALVVSIWFVSSLVDSPDKQPDTIPTKSSAATPSRVFTQELVEDLAAVLDRGHVALEAASGNGASSGLAVDAYLINQRNTEVSLDVSLRQPLFLRNRGRGQNMFVIKVYLQGGGYLSDGFRSFISLQPKRRTPVQFIAYCADFDKDNPSATEEFVRDVSPVSLLRLLQSISNYELSHPDQDVTIAAQTAIWLAQGVSIEEVRTKFEVNRSQELLAREFLK
ncbi:MAG: tetratricopeptide repeat protein [Planctomycetia bacterium]|nr:tetratricopeptide repeat protein [Planctomycetia bacterium]